MRFKDWFALARAVSPGNGGRLTKADTHSKPGRPCHVRSKQPFVVTSGEKIVSAKTIAQELLEFSTAAGSSYEMVPRADGN